MARIAIALPVSLAVQAVMESVPNAVTAKVAGVVAVAVAMVPETAVQWLWRSLSSWHWPLLFLVCWFFFGVCWPMCSMAFGSTRASHATWLPAGTMF